MTEYNITENGAVVALGNFDGVHLGHLAVINNAVDLAKKKNAVPCALLFTSHPLKELKGFAPPALMTRDMQDRALKKAGIEKIIRLDFSDVRHLSPEDFVREILFNRLNAKGVSCGYNYRFGEKAKGTAELLCRLCEESGVEIKVAEEATAGGVSVSSTKIRNALKEGDIPLATSLLGKPFSYDFTVMSGDRRGRLLGAPTINQHFPAGFITPRFGVYASIALIDDKIYPAVTNFGVRPTVGTPSARSETCILGFSGDLYGCNVPVALIEFIRDEVKFSSLRELSRQIEKDADKAKVIFEEFTARYGKDKRNIF